MQAIHLHTTERAIQLHAAELAEHAAVVAAVVPATVDAVSLPSSWR